MVHTTAETARGKEMPAKKTRKARSPMNFSPMLRKLARPLWTMAKTKRIINITNCKPEYKNILKTTKIAKYHAIYSTN